MVCGYTAKGDHNALQIFVSHHNFGYYSSLAFNSFMPSEMFYSYQMGESICQIRGVWSSLV